MRNRTALFALLGMIVIGGGLAACGDDPATPTDAGADAPTTTVPTGTPDASPDAPVGPTAIASGPSRGSAVALSWNDATLVAVNRDVGSVTVFDVKYGADGALLPTVLVATTEQVTGTPLVRPVTVMGEVAPDPLCVPQVAV